MTGSTRSLPELVDVVPANSVRTLIDETDREFVDLEQRVAEVRAEAEAAEARVAAEGADPTAAWMVVRLQRFLDGLREEAERDATAAVEVARHQARVRVREARERAAHPADGRSGEPTIVIPTVFVDAQRAMDSGSDADGNGRHGRPAAPVDSAPPAPEPGMTGSTAPAQAVAGPVPSEPAVSVPPREAEPAAMRPHAAAATPFAPAPADPAPTFSLPIAPSPIVAEGPPAAAVYPGVAPGPAVNAPTAVAGTSSSPLPVAPSPLPVTPDDEFWAPEPAAARAREGAPPAPPQVPEARPAKPGKAKARRAREKRGGARRVPVSAILEVVAVLLILVFILLRLS